MYFVASLQWKCRYFPLEKLREIFIAPIPICNFVSLMSLWALNWMVARTVAKLSSNPIFAALHWTVVVVYRCWLQSFPERLALRGCPCRTGKWPFWAVNKPVILAGRATKPVFSCKNRWSHDRLSFLLFNEWLFGFKKLLGTSAHVN